MLGTTTYYTGKLFKVHTVDNYNSPYAAGFTSSDFLLDPFTTITSTAPSSARAKLPEAMKAMEAENPFFLTIAPSDPHTNIQMSGSILDPDPVSIFDAPVSAKRHENLFKDVVPRTKSFNPDHPSGANWLLQLEQQNTTNVDWNGHFYRQRFRALQAVDELQRQWLPYRPAPPSTWEILRVLIVRGLGVAANHTTDIVTTNTDLAPAFFDLLEIPQRDEFDGTAFPVTEVGLEAAHHAKGEHVNVEYWGFAGGEGIYHREVHENNTYKAIRIAGSGYNLYYSI
ncbi:uncharacterized protein BJX67DRAFT_380034 [Aspergillus lucknowensis]|uniref:Uncharacterized protein n=1 Tax=Aspergillus lucknowensis TaxID=176173 RepID=A0ABR4LVV1_9EURO